MMSNEKKFLRIHVMDNGVWDVDVPINVWEDVFEYCKKKGYYTIQEEHHRIWATTLGQLIDLIQKASEVFRKMPS